MSKGKNQKHKTHTQSSCSDERSATMIQALHASCTTSEELKRSSPAEFSYLVLAELLFGQLNKTPDLCSYAQVFEEALVSRPELSPQRLPGLQADQVCSLLKNCQGFCPLQREKVDSDALRFSRSLHIISVSALIFACMHAYGSGPNPRQPGQLPWGTFGGGSCPPLLSLLEVTGRAGCHHVHRY